MTENLTWVEIHDLITTMKKKLETQDRVTKTISRINYAELLGALRNQSMFQHDKSIFLQVTCQEGVITIIMRRK